MHGIRFFVFTCKTSKGDHAVLMVKRLKASMKDALQSVSCECYDESGALSCGIRIHSCKDYDVHVLEDIIVHSQGIHDVYQIPYPYTMEQIRHIDTLAGETLGHPRHYLYVTTTYEQLRV